MIEIVALAYGAAAYLLFVATITYSIAFIGNLPVPQTVDAGPAGPMVSAAAIDVLLIAAFAIQHSVMARPAFKRMWTRFIPEPVERSTYVLVASVVLAVVMACWRPIAQPVIWSVEHPAVVLAIHVAFDAGWLLLLASSFMINHFEMFGLQQVVARAFRLRFPPPQFRTPLVYRHVRHPIYLGFLVAFWATPRMTAGHLLFAIGMSGYIFVGIWFEERDLIAQFGQRYRDYRRSAGMLLPKR